MIICDGLVCSIMFCHKFEPAIDRRKAENQNPVRTKTVCAGYFYARKQTLRPGTVAEVMKKSAKRVDAAINNTGIRKSSVKADASDTVPIM